MRVPAQVVKSEAQMAQMAMRKGKAYMTSKEGLRERRTKRGKPLMEGHPGVSV